MCPYMYCHMSPNAPSLECNYPMPQGRYVWLRLQAILIFRLLSSFPLVVPITSTIAVQAQAATLAMLGAISYTMCTPVGASSTHD